MDNGDKSMSGIHFVSINIPNDERSCEDSQPVGGNDDEIVEEPVVCKKRFVSRFFFMF